MKKIIIAVVLSVFSGLCAMEEKAIRCASAEQLESRLRSNAFRHFAESTQIHKRIGDKEITSAALAEMLEGAISDYNNTAHSLVAQSMIKRKPELLKLLLEEHSDGILD